MSLILNIPDEEWIFGLQCHLPPEAERWHCWMYESFREIEILRENFKSFWAMHQRVPETREELANIASKHRVLIGDLNTAYFLFLVPEYPETPWGKLKKSTRENVISFCPPNDTTALDIPIDSLYLCISQKSLESKDLQKFNIHLLIDWRTSNAKLSHLFVKKISTAWEAWRADPIELTGLAQCSCHKTIIPALDKAHLGLSWHKYNDVCFSSEKTLAAWKQKVDLWLKKYRPTECADSREYLAAELKRLAAYRIRKLGAEKNISLSSIINQERRWIPQGIAPLYNNASDWYQNITICEEKLNSLRDLVLPLSSGRSIYNGKTEMKNWFTGIVLRHL